MKILFSPAHYSYDDTSGSELAWTYDLVSRLAKLNNQSVVVTGFKRLTTSPSYRIIELTPKWNEVDYSQGKALVFCILYSFKTSSLLWRDKFNVVHHVLPFGLERTFNLAILFNRKTPFIVGPVQSPLDFKDKGFDQSASVTKRSRKTLESLFNTVTAPLLRKLSDLTLQKAKFVIVPHLRTRQLLQGKVSDPKKLVVIPMGIDTNHFLPSKSKKSDAKVVFITASFLIKRKNIECIIRAMRILKDLNDCCVLKIVGDGPEQSNLVHLVESLGLKELVEFNGWLSREMIIQAYQKSDVYISMSRSESFSNTCLEAMACGLPVISTKVGCFEDTVEEGSNGYLIGQNDDTSLANRMQALINDRKKLANMQLLARKKMLNDYDWDTVVIPKFMDVYNSLG